MTRPSIAALKGIWRDQIFQDRRLTPATFKVGYCLADFVTMKATAELYAKGRGIIIFPSQELVRKRTLLAPDTVRLAIRDLVRRGHLCKLRRGNQFNGANQYQVVFQEEPKR